LDSLTERLATTGSVVCRLGGFIRRLINQQNAEPIPDVEWEQHGRVAVFFAFVALGGDVDSPETFNWKARPLIGKSLSLLQQLTLGSQSDLYDKVLRTRARLIAHPVDEMCWDAWQTVCAEELRELSHHGARWHTGKGIPFVARDRHQEFLRKTERKAVSEALIADLQATLKPQEAVWLVRRYRDGVPTSVLAKEMVANNEHYQTPDGLLRAIRCIDVAVHRARHKAQRLLPSKWAHLATEMA
jgi:hypothetical protein